MLTAPIILEQAGLSCPGLFSTHAGIQLWSLQTSLVLLQQELCQFWSPSLGFPRDRTRLPSFSSSPGLPGFIQGDWRPSDHPWDHHSSQRTPGVSFSPLGLEAGVSSTVFPSPEVLIASAPFHKPASQAGSSRKRWMLIQFSETWQREMDARLPYPAFVSPEHRFPPCLSAPTHPTPRQPHQSSCAGRKNSTFEDTKAFLLYNKQLTFAEGSPYLEPVLLNPPVLQNPWGALEMSPCLGLTTKISRQSVIRPGQTGFFLKLPSGL